MGPSVERSHFWTLIREFPPLTPPTVSPNLNWHTPTPSTSPPPPCTTVALLFAVQHNNVPRLQPHARYLSQPHIKHTERWFGRLMCPKSWWTVVSSRAAMLKRKEAEYLSRMGICRYWARCFTATALGAETSSTVSHYPRLECLGRMMVGVITKGL